MRKKYFVFVSSTLKCADDLSYMFVVVKIGALTCAHLQILDCAAFKKILKTYFFNGSAWSFAVHHQYI